LLREVNLETDVKHNVVLLFRSIGNATDDRDDGHKVEKSSAVLSKIEKTCLALFIGGEALLHIGNCFWGGMMALISSCNAAARCLEETTVTAKDFMLFVPGQAIEGGGGINDGAVVSPHVDDDERTRHINRTKVDALVRSIGDTT
jgi:hypothetical protein